MRIIVDAFGGDNAPLEILKGCALAVEEFNIDILLCGDEKTIREVAAANEISLNRMEILQADDVMSMEDHPKSILKEKKESSMAVGMRALHDGMGDAFVTAGSTGAALVGATFLGES